MSNTKDDRPIVVSVGTLVDDDATVAEVAFGRINCDEFGNVNVDSPDAIEVLNKFITTGSSKRTQVDRLDTDLGKQLAIGRALKKLSTAILEDAQKQIDKHDREREDRKSKKSKKSKKAKTDILDETEIATITKSAGERRVTKEYINGQLVKVVQAYI